MQILYALIAWPIISIAVVGLWCLLQEIRYRMDKRERRKAHTQRQMEANIQYINQILSAQ